MKCLSVSVSSAREPHPATVRESLTDTPTMSCFATVTKGRISKGTYAGHTAKRLKGSGLCRSIRRPKDTKGVRFDVVGSNSRTGFFLIRFADSDALGRKPR